MANTVAIELQLQSHSQNDLTTENNSSVIEVPITVIPLEANLENFQILVSEQTSTTATGFISQWQHVARLARIRVKDDELIEFCSQLDSILSFIEQLAEVNVDGVEPMTSVMPMVMKKRPDIVDDGGDVEAVLKNAPARQDDYFVVPKVVE